MRHQLVFATGNAGKLKEARNILADLGVEVLSPADIGGLPDVEETGETFEANAILKARAAAEHSGLPALADDSGLVVDALGGAPGVHSARYAGPDATDADRVAKLLLELAETGNAARTARFECAIALVTPDGETHTVRGTCEGTIRDEPSGTGGFGYDPVFQPKGHTVTFSEMSSEEKNAISHRGKALAQIPAVVRSLL